MKFTVIHKGKFYSIMFYRILGGLLTSDTFWLYLNSAVVWLKIKHSIQSSENFIGLPWARVWSLAPPVRVMTEIFKTHVRHL